MNKYGFGPRTREWLGKRIGHHFDDHPVPKYAHGVSVKPNKNLRMIMERPSHITVYDGEDQIRLKISAGSEFVAFRPADSRYGVIAAIFDSSGGQLTFLGDKNRLIFWSADDLHGRQQISMDKRRPRLPATE